MPIGALVTSPLPVPVVTTTSCRCSSVNVAVTDLRGRHRDRARRRGARAGAAPAREARVRRRSRRERDARAIRERRNHRSRRSRCRPGCWSRAPPPVPGLPTASCRCSSVNVAVTDFAAVIDTVHVVAAPRAGAAPAREARVRSGHRRQRDARAVREVGIAGRAAVDAGRAARRRVPLPVPAFATLSGSGSSVNVAVTDFAALIETTHVAAEPRAGAAPAREGRVRRGDRGQRDLSRDAEVGLARRAAVDARRAARDACRHPCPPWRRSARPAAARTSP